MTSSVPITERRYVGSLILVTTRFFLWALGVNLNKEVMRYPHLVKAVLAQFFYVGAQVGVASIPAGVHRS